MEGYNIIPKLIDTEDTHMLTLSRSLRPEMIRWPGGFIAHRYEWFRGMDIKDFSAVGSYHRFPVDQLLPYMGSIGAMAVMLVINPYSSPSVVMMQLKRAKLYGAPLTHVEIGNEVYSDKEMMTAQQYVDYCRQLIPLLREDHPEVKIGVCALAKKGDTSKHHSWNEHIQQLDDIIDAYCEHIYVPQGWTLDQRMAKYFKHRIQDTDKARWITEYGTRNGLAQLLELREALGLFAEIRLNYCLIGYNEHWSKIDRKTRSLTAEGQAYQALAQDAFNPMDHEQTR